MLKIAICEDEKIFRVELEKYLRVYLEQKSIFYKIDTYEKGEKLLTANHKEYDVIYLDVQIEGGLNGIEVAERLRKEQNESLIIFLTSHGEQVYKAFEVAAFRYLLKPLDKKILYETMDRALKKITTKKKNSIALQQGNTYIQLPICEITYFETEQRKVRVHTKSESYLVENTLGDIEKTLTELNFYRIHRCYLIHFKYVKSHNEKTVLLETGEELLISRLKISLFKKIFIDYLRRECNVRTD